MTGSFQTSLWKYIFTLGYNYTLAVVTEEAQIIITFQKGFGHFVCTAFYLKNNGQSYKEKN